MQFPFKVPKESILQSADVYYLKNSMSKPIIFKDPFLWPQTFPPSIKEQLFIIYIPLS